MTASRKVKGEPPEWLQRWARFLLRYLIGGGGLLWETVIDRLNHAEALVIFAGLAKLPDVIAYQWKRGQVEAVEQGDDGPSA